jgi:hypothetical protein
MNKYRTATIVVICATILCIIALASASAQSVPGTSAIKGVVYNDTNKDGLHQITEQGVPSLTIQLLTPGGLLIGTLVTDHNGYFNFTGLAAGQYIVYVIVPQGYTYSTTQNVAVSLLDNSLGKVCLGIYVVDKPPFAPRTIGYWKNHPDDVEPLLPISLGTPGGTKSVRVTDVATAVGILSQSGGASNGIVKLKAQLLAAKLDIASGSDDAAVFGKIIEADNFLSTHDEASWKGLSKSDQQYVLALKDIFDAFNNGGE